jgi:hypothetical protein
VVEESVAVLLASAVFMRLVVILAPVILRCVMGLK